MERIEKSDREQENFQIDLILTIAKLSHSVPIKQQLNLTSLLPKRQFQAVIGSF